MKKVSGIIGFLIGIWGIGSLSFVRMMEEHGFRVADTTFACLQSQEPFAHFIDSFAHSASFQYSRIHFPLKTDLLLYIDDKEVNLSYTQDRWLLLGTDYLDATGRTDGYFTRYTEDQPLRKTLVGGYPDSETVLQLVFESLDDGLWYVTDGYNDCYYSGVRNLSDMEEAKRRIADENRRFISLYP